MAGLARVADRGAFAATARAGLLHREKALLHAHLAVSRTGTAGFRRRSRARAAAGAFGTLFQRRYANLDRGAVDGVFEAELEVVLQVGALANARAAAAENIAEDIAEGVAETAAAESAAGRLVDTGMAELVVGGPFVRIGEYVESFLGFLELRFRLGIVRIAVRVVFHRQAPKRLLDIGVGGVVRYFEDFVVIAF